MDALPGTKAAVKTALGREQNVNVWRSAPTEREMSAEEAAQDFLTNPVPGTGQDYDPYMKWCGHG